MSKADKMFIELGYKDINRYDTQISYQDGEKSWESKEITFYYQEKSFTAVENSDDYYVNELILPIDIKLYLAIQEKMKELGWIE